MIKIGIKVIKLNLNKDRSSITATVTMRLGLFGRLAITTATYVAMMGSTQATGLATATTANDGALQQYDS